MHTSRDGRLIGVETDFQLGIFRPIAALAYGLESGSIRYRAGGTFKTGFEVPLAGLRLGDFSAALVDWPSTPILGREGQMGIELGLSLGPAHFSGFFGRLWPFDGRAPQAAFITVEVTRSLKLPFELTLSSSSYMIMGLVLPEVEGGGSFSSTVNTLSLSLGELAITGRWGSLKNEAGLEGFEFTTGVRGISRPLKGHKFWNITLERRFPIYETSFELPLPPELIEKVPLPKELPVSLEGALFLQAGGATRKEPEEQGIAGQKSDGEGLGLRSETLLSWGISAELSVHRFSIHAELIITQEGETRFSMSFL